jgi:hypothetical protein
MLREAKIILPITNDGQSIMDLHTAMQRDLAATFGGFTVVFGDGGWIDGAGNLVNDTVAIYSIAAPVTPEANANIAGLAMLYGHRANQEAVYYVQPDGQAFIEPIKAQSQEAA